MRAIVHKSTSLALLALLAACVQVPAPLRPTERAVTARTPRAPAPEVKARARIAAVGDVLLQAAVQDAAAAAARSGSGHDGYDSLFAGAAPLLKSADLAFANLETPVAPRSGKKVRSFEFNAPPVALAALEDAGVRVVSFANNHVYDQGRAGLAESLQHLAASHLVALGAGATCEEAARAHTLEAGGIKIAFIGATQLFNQDLNAGAGEPCVFRMDEKKVMAEAARARAAGAEAVVLSVHWGVEYESAPSAEQIATAHRLLDAGVDVILGHHPHVLEPAEVYRRADGTLGLVAYSLGNFVSNQSRTYAYGVQPDRMGDTRDGVALSFSLVKKDYGGGLYRVEIADLSAQPLWTDNNALELTRDPSLAPAIGVVSLDAELLRARQALEHAAGEARVGWQKRVELLSARRKISAAVVGDDLYP